MNTLQKQHALVDGPPASGGVHQSTRGAWTDMNPSDHFVQFYEEDKFLVDSVAGFIGAGLGAGEGAIVIATPAHRQALAKRLAEQGVDVAAVQSRDQYVALDAAETLSRFMVNGSPDQAAFNEAVGGVVARMAKGRRGLRAFGEMVALLWADGNGAAAIRLEELWNDLGKAHSFCLFCAYPMNGFGDASNGKEFEHICGTHSRVLPSERYSARNEEERLREIAALQQKALALEAEVSRRQRAEKALRAGEERLRQMVSLMPAAVYTCDSAGRITYFNRRAAELWGREPALGDEDQKFCGAFKLWLPDGSPLPHAQTPMAVAVRDCLPCRDREVVIERPDGSSVTVNVNIDPLFDKAGRHCGAINVFQDITGRKHAEEALRASEERLAADLRATTLLYEVGNQCAAGGEDFDRCLDHIVEVAMSVTGAGRGNLQLLDSESGALVIAAQRGFEKPFLEFFSGVHRHNAAACGAAMKSCQRVVVEDVTQSEIFAGTPALEVMLGAGARAVQSTPLVSSAGNLLGMISTHFEKPHRPTEREMRLVDLLARQAADYLERKGAEEALRSQQTQLQAELADTRLLQETSAALIEEGNVQVLYEKILDAAAAIMQSDRACMQAVDQKEDALRLLTWRGFDRDFGDLFMWCRHDSPTCCSIARRTGERVIVPDVEKWDFIANTAAVEDFRKLGVGAVQSTPLFSRGGKLVGMISTHWRQPHQPTERDLRLLDILARQAADLLERRQAEEALRKRNERLELLSETLGHLLSARDPETIVRELFPKVAAHLGVDTYFNFMVNKTGDALTLHSCAGIPEETARSIGRIDFGQAICGTVAQTRKPIHATDIQNSDYDKAALVRGFGIQCYACNPLMVGDRLLGTLSFASRTRTAFDEDELQFLRLISQHAAVALDRLQNAERLRESEERFRAVLDNSATVIYLKDLEGRYLLTNKRHEDLFHTRKEHVLGKTDAEIFPPDIAAKFRANDLVVMRSGEPLETEEVAPHDDGPHTYISIKFPLRRADGTIYAVAGISTDITERKRAQESAARLAAVVEHSDDAIISMDLDATIKSWNRGAQRLFGYTAQETVGQPVSMLIPEGRQDEEPDILKRIRNGETVENYETIRRRKDGMLLDISLTVSPVKDAEGNVVGASKVARDITDKIRAREKLEQTVAERTAQLRDTVAELEAFSYSVAHDMRAPLRSMNSYSRFLEEDFAHALPQQGKDYLHRIAAGAARLDALITDVLNYSKISRSEMLLESVDVEKLTREIVDSYPDLRESGAAILVQSPLPRVIGNPAALTQCLSNLLSNAVKFVRPGAAPQVRVWAEKKPECVRLWVEDNGIGISQEGQQRIFHMFQRLNPTSEFDGTGIGLTIVRKAVERMGGRVGVESQPDVGSRFWIELKRAT